MKILNCVCTAFYSLTRHFILAQKQHDVVCVCFRLHVSLGKLCPSVSSSFCMLLHTVHAVLLLSLQVNFPGVRATDVSASVKQLFFLLKLPSPR